MTETTYTSPVTIGDKVYKIEERQKPVWEPCGFCAGIGTITANGITCNCPNCYGRKGITKWETQKWQVVWVTGIEGDIELYPALYTIRKIGLEHTDKKKPIWSVMCEETGVGSGTIHYVEDLFVSLEDAEKECDRRNTK